MPSVSLSPQLRSEYQRLFDTCIIRQERLAEVNVVIDKIINAQEQYKAVENKLHIPWFFISIIHCMEGSLSFNKHLHNGDPLTKKPFIFQKTGL